MPKTIPIIPHAPPVKDGHKPPRLGSMLCADTSCDKRTAPTVEQLATIITSDNELSAAVDLKITGALREYAGERFAAQASRMDAIEVKIDQQGEATKRVEASTADIVDLMNSWTGAMRTIEKVGKAVKPVSWIIGFFTTLIGLWAAVRGLFGG